MACYAFWTVFCREYLLSVQVFYCQLYNHNHNQYVFTQVIKISLTLPIVTNFPPVSYERNVKQHIPFKFCTWRGV
jgi:hypothetical protein